MIRIALDPSAQFHNEGLGGYIEAYAAWQIATSCAAWLEDKHGDQVETSLSRAGIETYKHEADYLEHEIHNVNLSHARYCVAIHSDAGGGRGVTCFKGGAVSYRLGQCLLDEISKVLKLNRAHPIDHYKDRPGHRYLGIIRRTIMPTCLIECGFHDNKEDMKVLGTPDGRGTIGQALAKGIAKFLGLRTEPVAPGG